MEDLLSILIEESWQAIERSNGDVERLQSFSVADDFIKVAIGMRRSGKTHFMYQTIRQLLGQAVAKQHILFINFEDERLLPMSAQELGQLIEAFYRLYPANHNRRCYLFLDEVQNVADWQRVVRRFYDTKDTQIYLTGSSAKLLSQEIHTSLRGRAMARQVFPYNFEEFLRAHNIAKPSQPFGNIAYDHMREQLLNYFEIGGFPAVQTIPDYERAQVLQSYVDTVILKDVVERYKVTNVTLLRYLAFSVLQNACETFSVSKFCKDIKSQGYRVSRDTIYQYLQYLEDACLIYPVTLYSPSIRVRQNQYKKYYAVDNGLLKASSFEISHNYGRLLENLVYLDLKRQFYNVYYYRTQSGYEVDFIAVDYRGHRQIVQVTWDMTDKLTYEREQRALEQAQHELGCEGTILTAKDYLRQLVVGS